jgi:pimeloyl-CoA dehydrogenase small subunit
MDFDLTDEQRLLQESLGRLLAETYSFDQRKGHLAQPEGWSRDLWRRYADMGLLALPFDEADGGFGGGPVDTMVVMEAFGRALALEPYLATVVLAGGLLRRAGAAAQRAELVPQIAGGGLLLAFAHAEPQSRFDLADVSTAARRDGEGWVLSGRKRHVLNGGCADKLIVSARMGGDRRDREGLALFVVDTGAPGVSRRAYPTQDRRRSAEVDLDQVRVGPDALLGNAGAALPVIEQVVDEAIAALCAEAVGGMAQAHEMTLDYLKMRQQFGRPIGAFQALQHRAVDMLIQLEQARSMAMYAAIGATDPDPLERRRAVSAAKVQIGRSGKFVGGQAIQLHGGIGMTDEFQIGHYYRRLTMIDLQFGDVAHHLSAVARAGGLLEPRAFPELAAQEGV